MSGHGGWQSASWAGHEKPLHQRRASSASFLIEVTTPSPTASISVPRSSAGLKGKKVVLERLSINPRFEFRHDESASRSWNNTPRSWINGVMYLLAGLAVCIILLKLWDALKGGWVDSDELRLGNHQGFYQGMMKVVPLPQSESIACDPGEPCAFLLPARIGEQDSKAQNHLYQLGLLALSLNRKLVLPNVRNGRLSACHPYPFSFYFQTSALSRLGIPAIEQQAFERWTTQARDYNVTAQVIRIDRQPSPATDTSVLIQELPDEEAAIPQACARRARLSFDSHIPSSFSAPPTYQKSLVKFAGPLLDSLLTNMADVLVVDYDLRAGFLQPELVQQLVPSLSHPPLPFSPFPLAKEWQMLGQSIAEKLSPFIVVHWRTETLPATSLAPCGSALVAKLMEIKKLHPSLRLVWLATDYPIEDLWKSPRKQSLVSTIEKEVTVPHPGTSGKYLTEEHHEAMKEFLEELSRANTGLRITSFGKEEPNLKLSKVVKTWQTKSQTGDLAGVDLALGGMIDKVIAGYSEIFLVAASEGGEDEVCGKVSSFAKEVAGVREERRRTGRDEKEKGSEEEKIAAMLWNTVSTWSRVSDAVDDE